MKDPVIAQINSTHAKAVERAYAEQFDLKILPDEPVYAHGRPRGAFRLDGRPSKPKKKLPPARPTRKRQPRASAIPTPTSGGKKATGTTEDGATGPDNPEESK